MSSTRNVKARHIARIFEEQNLHSISIDSPTSANERLRLIMIIIASNN